MGDGDLSARVLDDNRNDDEVGQLARTFNTMAERISNQQTELITARDDLDERAKFTEMVLSGVSSGVIGVDENGRINHVNEAAEFVFNLNETEVAGRKLEDVIPAFAELLRSGSKKVKTAKSSKSPSATVTATSTVFQCRLRSRTRPMGSTSCSPLTMLPTSYLPSARRLGLILRAASPMRLKIRSRRSTIC